MNNYHIYTDFDGTIALNDVGDTLFSNFSGVKWREPIEKWEKGLISSRECLTLECEMCRITKRELEDFSDIQKIDPHFIDFVSLCYDYEIPVTILSDGLDFYINRILQNNGLSHIPVFSNHLEFVGMNRIKPVFPYFGKGCPNCANCKGYHLQKKAENNIHIVFIGDGLSDRCALDYADIIFAKDALKQYCLDNNVAFHEFDSFFDVRKKLTEEYFDSISH